MIEDYAIEFNLTGVIAEDVMRYLVSYKCQKTAKHCANVADQARTLALRFDCDPERAEKSGYLHDISAVIPNDQRIEFARSQNVDVLPEEERFPMIIHQKLSVVLASEIFKVMDNEVLSAIGCHTTLKAGASRLDKVVFLADKIAWDQKGSPPYIHDVTEALEISLDAAALAYINYLWGIRARLRVVHPWLIDARRDLMRKA